MNPKPYFESVRDVYVNAAAELYKLAAGADFDTADPAQYIARALELHAKAFETWPLTTRQDRRLGGLRARAELNTPEGRDKRQRILDALDRS